MLLKLLPPNWRYLLLTCLLSVFAVTFLKLVFFVMDYKDLTEIRAERFKNTPVNHAQYEPSKLTHRMVKFDESNGLISEKEAQIAYGNINNYLKKVKDRCNIGNKIEEFLQCANNALGENFYYKSAGSVGEGYTNHHSDCDSNVYLLFDAAKVFNKNIDIVYAPRHAFISFHDDENGINRYWETTANENRGQLADLTQPLYRKTFNDFYYSPIEEGLAEKIYPILTLSYVDTAKRESIIDSLDKTLSNNPLLLDQYYSQLEKNKELTEEKIENLNNIIQNDISAIDKRLILSRYYLNKNDIDKAKSIMSQIDDNECDLSCMEVRKQFSSVDCIYYYIMDGFLKLNVKAPVFYFKNLIEETIFLVYIMLAIFIGMILQHNFNSKNKVDTLHQK
ncbi:hypothetical protein [Klebsiella spallanzanii]|uniref:hypothetical protein n=1 Tax=Klebsiella spallanzanii TaxID=2587528 RepID=UPI001119DC2F|nr:hypothetical protein [Klebsiella spallanzanii]